MFSQFKLLGAGVFVLGCSSCGMAKYEVDGGP
jgi:hypothetical protein